jgi:uncharacterized protein (DUF2249 family)
MSDTRLITPETKILALLESYPQLEETLLNISPAFAKLQNPLLRRTVARMATLRQVAQIGNVPLAELINRLRREAGQTEGTFEDSMKVERPNWLNTDNIEERLDARPMLEAGEHPLGVVLAALQKLPNGKIYELTTPFLPAPLLEQVRQKGFQVYSETVSENQVKSYFCKP